MADEITLGYWDLRGLAEPIRFLLHYKGIKFTDKRYKFEDYPKWMEEKFSLGLDFPNLPHYFEGDIKLSQSTTILRYLAHKHGLEGKDCKQKLRVALVEQQLIDTRMFLILHAIGKGFDASKEDFLKKVPDSMKLYEKFIGDNEYLTGDAITYVDFLAMEVFDFYRLFEKNVFDDFPNLNAYLNRMKNLPQLQDYLHSSTHKKWPVFGPLATTFGGTGDAPEHA